jgi:hypothetical protein
MMRYTLSLCLLVLSGFIFAQDSGIKMVKYSPDFRFEDGFYLNFVQVKNNSPVPPARVVTNLDHTDNDFYKNILDQPKFSFFNEIGVRQQINTKDLWGFSRNGVLYIQLSEGFSRVTIIGQICHFVATITTYDTRYYDPYSYNPYSYNSYYSPYSPYSYSPRTTKNSEMKQFLIDFNTGEVMDYDLKSIEVMLMKDPELYDEFAALKKKKQKQLKFYYIRQFNERNPLYLPVKTLR